MKIVVCPYRVITLGERIVRVILPEHQHRGPSSLLLSFPDDKERNTGNGRKSSQGPGNRSAKRRFRVSVVVVSVSRTNVKVDLDTACRGALADAANNVGATVETGRA